MSRVPQPAHYPPSSDGTAGADVNAEAVFDPTNRAETENESTSGDSEESLTCQSSVVDKIRSIHSANHEPLGWAGLFAQYFSVGLMNAGPTATIYGVFQGYLNVPGYVYSAALQVTTIAWSFKFFFGVINDTVPIRGFRRKPYMVFGWWLCSIFLLVLAVIPLPAPYWCVDGDGNYITKNADGSPATPCNRSAKEMGGKYAMLLMMACFGYVIADVAADGLMTEFARREPVETRGRAQTTIYLVRAAGEAVSTLFVGFLMNGKLYLGTFSWGLSFQSVCLCYMVPSLLMVPISLLFIREPTEEAGEKHVPLGAYTRMCWDLIKSKACFYVIIYLFFTSAIGYIGPPTSSQIQTYWANVGNLQSALASFLSSCLFMVGLAGVKRWFLNTDWRKILAGTTVVLVCIDALFQFFTIFGVVRNQYFFLADTLTKSVPSSVNFIVATFVIVEIAQDGNEGMVYGLLTTTSNLGTPFAAAISNQLFMVFRPAISDPDNYTADTRQFRLTVCYAVLTGYAFSFVAQVFLYFLPGQKAQAQQWISTWSTKRIYGVLTVVGLSLAFAYSLTVLFLAMGEHTYCLRIAGGDGCDQAEV